MKLNSLQLSTFFIASFFFIQTARAQTSIGGKSCEGVWRTIDDESGKVRSHVRIWEAGGKYYGKIEKLLNQTAEEGEDPICTVCPGDRKNKKVIEMVIVQGMVKETSRYAQGKILDPKKGKEYQCTMWLTDKNTMQVRGWWGMLYRTQTWNRVD